MKVVVINGFPRSGKSTFVEYVKKWNHPTMEVSMVDFTKKVAKAAGWHGEKEPEDRRFLAHLKDLLEEWRDKPFEDVRTRIEAAAKHYKEDFTSPEIFDHFIVFIHSREPRDIERLVEYFNAKTVFIERAAASENEQSNHADSSVLNYDYDYKITNNEGLKELEDKARVFISLILEREI